MWRGEGVECVVEESKWGDGGGMEAFDVVQGEAELGMSDVAPSGPRLMR